MFQYSLVSGAVDPMGDRAGQAWLAVRVWFARRVFWCDRQIALSRSLPETVPGLRLPGRTTLAWLEPGRALVLDPFLERRRAAWTLYLQSGLECMAAFRDGVIVGVQWFARQDDIGQAVLQFRFPRDHVYAFSLEVAPALRHTGLAGALQWQAWEQFRAAGMRQVIRLTSLRNGPALSLALRMGFRPCGRVRVMCNVLGYELCFHGTHEAGRYDGCLPWHRIAGRD